MAIDSALHNLIEFLPNQQQKGLWLIPAAVASRLAAGRIVELSRQQTTFQRLSTCECLCVFAAQGHWALLWGRRVGYGFHWTYFDPLHDGLRSAALDLAALLADYLGSSVGSFDHCTLYQQTDDFSCGTLAILHAAAVLGLPGRLAPASIHGLHHWLLAHSAPSQPVAGGTGDTTTTKALADLLVGHGVFPHEGMERARAVISKLGTATVQKALESN